MARSTIYVQYKSGQAASGIRVSLGFSGGNSPEVLTNSNGEAMVQHSSTGSARLYVDGTDVGEMMTPGEKAVTLPR